MNLQDQEFIAQAIRELRVDKPIMSCRVLGDRIELYLLGGAKVIWPIPSALDLMSTSELKRIARKRKIPGRSKMNRSELIKALEAIE